MHVSDTDVQPKGTRDRGCPSLTTKETANWSRPPAYLHGPQAWDWDWPIRALKPICMFILLQRMRRDGKGSARHFSVRTTHKSCSALLGLTAFWAAIALLLPAIEGPEKPANVTDPSRPGVGSGIARTPRIMTAVPIRSKSDPVRVSHPQPPA